MYAFDPELCPMCGRASSFRSHLQPGETCGSVDCQEALERGCDLEDLDQLRADEAQIESRLATFRAWFAYLCSREADVVFYADDPSRVSPEELEQAHYLDELGRQAAQDAEAAGADWREAICKLSE